MNNWKYLKRLKITKPQRNVRHTRKVNDDYSKSVPLTSFHRDFKMYWTLSMSQRSK